VNFRGKLIKAIVEKGHKVIACAPDFTSENIDQVQELGAETRTIPLQRDGQNIVEDIRFLFAVWKLLRVEAPDLLITYTIKPNIWGAYAAWVASVPSIAMITGLGYAFTDTGVTPNFKTRIVRRMVRILYRFSTSANWKIIFQNPDDPKDFSRAGCLGDMSKAHIVAGSGVDLEKFTPSPLPDCNRDGQVFLMISRLLFNKGVVEFARASIEVKKAHPKVRFILVGPRDYGPDGIPEGLLDEWRANGLEYEGAKKDVRKNLKECSVFVLPSYREGTPRAVLEAMASQRPVIVTDTPGCRETVDDNVNGYLVPPRDSDALARRMLDLLDINKAERFGIESLRLVRERFDVEKVNKAVLHILELD
jgi:glycosyltransferase involved in cell wall biosynthesis|tara:strand:- start:725 stop:1813 length:1089 start_codon:yes stop_codon:yes gene_type:complete